MNILDNKNSIRFWSFKCLSSNMIYTVISTRSLFDINKPSYLDNPLLSEDILRREDGLKRVFMRSELKIRFTNVEQVLINKNKYYD